MWGVEESKHLERVNTYRCNIYRGWTVVRVSLWSYAMMYLFNYNVIFYQAKSFIFYNVQTTS